VGADVPPTIDEVVEAVDRLFRSDSSYGDVEMTIVTPNWTRTLRMDIWTRGMDETFVRVTAPKKDAGTATLRVDTQMWNYFPKIDKVMKIPPSMMMGSWMGSDFTNDDIVKESSLIEDYVARFVDGGDAEDATVIELVPKEETVTVWGRIVVTVRTSDLIPLRQDFYDENGNMMRRMVLSDVRTFDDRRIPSTLEVVPMNKEGRKTIVRYVTARFDQETEDDVFSLRNLRRSR
jgi:outer membrane lipoprotein-sorting protein